MQQYHNCFENYIASQLLRYHKLLFQSVTDKKHHTFSSTAGARPTIPTILAMVIEEIRPIFAPP